MTRQYKIRNYKPGIKITKPCIIRNMPEEAYHAHPALSNSGLKMLLNCPAKYYYKYLSGEYEAKEKPCFKIGKACHTIILEGKKAFEKKYWFNPYGGATKEVLLQIAEQKGYDFPKSILRSDLEANLLELEGMEQKEIELDKNELNQIIGVSRSINSNPHAKGAFSQKGESELSLFWIDEETGLWLKCRPDFLPYDCKDVPDYKTAQSANPDVFVKDFIKYGYHVQAAMYREGIKNVCGIEVENFFFVVQEKEAPYITQVFAPEMSFVNYGETHMRAGINKFIECQEREIWGGYSENVVEMSVAPKPSDLASNFDEKNAICYTPSYLDYELSRY